MSKRPNKRQRKAKRKLPELSTPSVTQSRERPVLPHRPRAEKLIKRFYEPLVLLHFLRSVQGDHSERQRPDAPITDELGNDELRRNFLDNLCLICDYEKGGQTVTAAALQATPQGIVYWIAANEDLNKRIGRFLREVLGTLASVGLENSPDVEERIFRASIEFCHSKMKKLWSLARGPLSSVLTFLSTQEFNKDLESWLETFRVLSADMEALSRYAFQQRGSTFMTELTRLCAVHWSHTTPQDSLVAFKKVRHYIGRLGCLGRASKILVATAIRMPELFDIAGIKLCDSSGCVVGPSVDARLNLGGIATRMLPKSETERHEELLNALRFMDDKFGLMSRIREHYEDKNFKPRVHAELVLLEQIDQAEIDFVGDDRYIGCSKPACFCCYHYIRLHPGTFVLPACHHKIYLNWRPPEVAASANESSKKRQNEIMNRLIAVIRTQAISQALRRCRFRTWQPDSTTGIASSANFQSESDEDVRNRERLNVSSIKLPSFGTESSSGREALLNDRYRGGNSVSGSLCAGVTIERTWVGSKNKARHPSLGALFRVEDISENQEDSNLRDNLHDSELSDSDGGILLG